MYCHRMSWNFFKAFLFCKNMINTQKNSKRGKNFEDCFTHKFDKFILDLIQYNKLIYINIWKSDTILISDIEMKKNLTNEKELLNINKVIDNFDLYIVRVNKKSKDTLMKLIIISTD